MAVCQQKSGQGQAGTQFKKGRRPHNASRGHQFESLGELVEKIGAETRRVNVDGKEVQMSRAERLARLTIDRAISGDRRDLAQMLRLMIEHPSLSGPGREKIHVIIGGKMAHV